MQMSGSVIFSIHLLISQPNKLLNMKSNRPLLLVQVFKRDADLLEEWLSQKKSTLDDRSIGDSIEAVELLIQKHEDFEKMVYAQEDRFGALKRFTMVS